MIMDVCDNAHVRDNEIYYDILHTALGDHLVHTGTHKASPELVLALACYNLGN